MRWPFARKAAAPPMRGGWALAAAAGDVPQGYEAQVRAAYQRNAIGQRAVRMVAEGAASAPLIVAGTAHPATALVPGDLLETIATHLLLHGNAYIETGLSPAGAPAALWALRPERVTLETDAAGWPKSWLYRVGGRITRYPALGDSGFAGSGSAYSGSAGSDSAGLLHIRSINPLDDHYGLGCLGAAADAVSLLNAAAKWNRSLLENAARPSGALVHAAGDGGPLTPDQFGRLKDEIERAFQGAANAGRPMLLEGGLSWQSLALTPAEMDFGRAREAAAREVALAFGVPPMLLGLPGDATYANYRQANVALWRLTVLPLLGKILAALSRHLQPWWPGIAIEPDMDAIPALWEDRESLWRHVAGADFLSRDEKRALLGWGPGSADQAAGA
jgi:HK97 family phage portal protein